MLGHVISTPVKRTENCKDCVISSIYSYVFMRTAWWRPAKGRNIWLVKNTEFCCRLRVKCDGTRADTIFLLLAKRTSPFKSAGASVQSTTGSRGVCISGSNAGYTIFPGSEGYWLPTPFASFPFTSPPVRHRVPSGFNWTLPINHIVLEYLVLTEKNFISNGNSMWDVTWYWDFDVGRCHCLGSCRLSFLPLSPIKGIH